jgi:chemotaxis protein MotA
MTSLLLGAVLLVAVLLSAGSVEEFSLHQAPAASLLVVLGGTVGIFLLTTPSAVLLSLAQTLRTLFEREDDISAHRADLERLLKNRFTPTTSRSVLIQYASELWAQGVEPDLFIALLSQKKSELNSRFIDATQALKNLSKYPPALGMIGTVMGMVALFSKLDQEKQHIGSSLSLAMISTFLGLILTNFVVAPLADRLQVRQLRQQRTYEAIYEILLLINGNEPQALIQEEMQLRVA